MQTTVLFEDLENQCRLVEVSGVFSNDEIMGILEECQNLEICRSQSNLLGLNDDLEYANPTEGRPHLIHEPPISIQGRVCRQRRDVGFFSDESIGYQYSGQIARSQKLTPWMREMMRRVNEVTQSQFNGILLNRYMGPDNYISRHSDDERSLSGGKVVTCSFGQERSFVIRRIGESTVVADVPTKQGHLLIMDGARFQSTYTHEIPPLTKRQQKTLDGVVTPRYSLTFRRHLK